MVLTNSKIETLVVHYVGNRVDETLKLTKSKLNVSGLIRELLLKYFLAHFKSGGLYNLFHESDINLNELYAFSSKIFADPDCFYLQSVNISKHLFEQSTHPKIKGGEFYLAYFSGCVVDNEEVDAIGLFKSENKETFLKVNSLGDNYEINAEEGININKLDKGCLIFNTNKNEGYQVCIIDNLNKSSEAQYWKDAFLKVKPRQDSYHHTQNYLDLCKNFVTDKLPEEYDVSKTDQIDMLNRSVDFFKRHDQFDFNEFSNEVILQPELIDSFKSYKEQFKSERELPVADEFEISSQAVKKQSRIFKSVLKLDKNFHIYIHGNKELIERGIDETTGMKYYKIYFKEES